MTNDVPNPYAAPLNQAPSLAPADEKQWAVLTHVLSIFAGIIPAIVVYAMFKDRGPFIRSHAANQLNLQITMAIASFVGFIVIFGAMFVSIFASAASSLSNSASASAITGFGAFGGFFLGYVIIIGIRITGLVFEIRAAMAANRGELYRIPLIFRFVRDTA